VSPYQPYVEILLGNGDGTFRLSSSGPAVFGPIATSLRVVITATDLNSDGKLDLLVSQAGGVAVLLGNGDGTFQDPQFYAGASIYGSVAADFNGDGKRDLALATADFGGSVLIALGKGDGTFQRSVVSPRLPNSLLQYLVPGDFNNDGKVDLLGAGGDSDYLLLGLGNGDGTFQWPLFVGAPYLYSTGHPAYALLTGDFNGDANLDVAFLDPQDWLVGVYLGNGAGNFTPAGYFGTGQSPAALATGDFNGDGKLDVVTANPPANTV
jgi:hypothetical protein